jgi:hypothetical protein
LAKQKNKPIQLFEANELPILSPINMAGLVAAVPAYKLVWQINNTLPLQLLRVDDLFYKHKKGEEIYIQCFEYVDNEYDCIFRLVANKTSNNILIPEHRNTNYFLQLKGIHDELSWEQLLLQLKRLPFVLTVYEIDLEALKNKDLLYY